MARLVEKQAAKKVMRCHQKLLEELAAARTTDEKLRRDIQTACDGMLSQAVKVSLKEIPVEELNREKRGFRVKALHDRGYHTIADLHSLSVASLAAVDGISDEGARAIRKEVERIVETAKLGAKISISLDSKTRDATRLVQALSRYRMSETHLRRCAELEDAAAEAVRKQLAALEPAAGTFKWMFASADKKEKAAQAYEQLATMLSGPYGTEAKANTEALKKQKFQSDTAAWQDFSAYSIEFYNILELVCPGVLGTDDSVFGLPEELAQQIQEQPFYPEGLRCTLRRYQEWGVKYALHQQRALLGDEMGLGKTVQAIAAMVSLRNTGETHFMVVCPASVLTNWCREIQKMSDLTVTKIHGADREDAVALWKKQGGVAVTTYETTGHILLEAGESFSLLVVDEAHYIKNPEAQRTQNVKRLSGHAKRLLFMTGTALENRVEEMIQLISILQPSVAGTVRGMEFLASAPQFRERVAPVYYRRRREDVLTELPEKTESMAWCRLLPGEEKTYEEAVLSGNFAAARRVSWNGADMAQSSKAQRLLEIVEDAREEGRKVIVFSFFLDTIEKVCGLLGDCCYGPINGSVPPQKRQEMVDAFQQAPAGAVLAAQIQAGGTGLNIQAASVVILCEPQFKPSIENQAISRAYRMGQTRNVLVYRLLCEDTVDERITEILETKQEIFDAFADESVVAEQSRELDDQAFGNIMKEEAQRIQAKRESDK